MRQRGLRTLAVLATIIMMVLGCMMRYYQLHTIFDETGLPISGSPVTWMLNFLSGLMVVEGILVGWSLPRCRLEKRIYGRKQILSFLAGMAAGLCLAIGGIVEIAAILNGGAAGYELALYILQMLAGCCMLISTWRNWSGSASYPVLHAVICLWMVMVLLLNFKNWSMDPTILDYCFRLFALICGMCATYHIGTFGFDQGGRRVTTFWCMAGCYFMPVSAVGESLGWELMAIGMTLWLFCNVWQILDEPLRARKSLPAMPESEASEESETSENPIENPEESDS